MRSDICIVGNGVIGKALALGFAHLGCSVTLLSPTNIVSYDLALLAAGWDERVYALNQISRDFLSDINVWGALDNKRIGVIEEMCVRADDTAVSDGLMLNAYSAHLNALAWVVEDRQLNSVLNSALAFAPNISVVAGRAATLYSDSNEARITLDSGEVISSSLVVGADGASSWVRGQCDIGLDYRSYNQSGIVTTFKCELPHHGVAHQWFTKAKGVVALLPLPDDHVSLVWSVPQALLPDLMAQSSSDIASQLAYLSGATLGNLYPVEPEKLRAFPLKFIRAHKITAPRVALVGDAAHVVHPLAGQGMNLGFSDAGALLKAIAEREPYRDCGDSRVLARYARSRNQDVLLMQLLTDSLARLSGVGKSPMLKALDFGLHAINKIPFLKRRLIAHASGIYKK